MQTSDPPSLSQSDARFLRRLKLALALLLLAFAVQILVRQLPELWPLTRWEMYAWGSPRLSPTVRSAELRVIDTYGVIHCVPVRQLYTTIALLDDLPQRSLDLAFHEPGRYQAALLDQVRRRLPGVEIAELQLWTLEWPVNYDSSPPIDVAHPASERLTASLTVQAAP